MASLFELADSLITDEYAQFNTNLSPHEWSLPLSADLQDYSYKVGFKVISKDSEKFLLFISQLNLKERPAKNSILQSYIQFRDWDMHSINDLPSWSNFICTQFVPAAGSQPAESSVSCGYLPFDNLKLTYDGITDLAKWAQYQQFIADSK